MNTKTNAEMLKSLKQYNKTAREDKAKKEGFASATIMIAYLQRFIDNGEGSKPYVSLVDTPSVIKKTPKAKVITPKERITIHVVDILDSSGSMSGSKYAAATEGINHGVKTLKEDVSPVNYTYTMCDFSTTNIFRHTLASLDEVENFRGYTRDSTALYDAIGDTVNIIRRNKKPTEKILVNIYTDGEENASRRFRSNDISQMIEDLGSQGWTFTFIGTEKDVKFAQSKLKFHDSNTLVHDNTGAGIARGMSVNSTARTSYSAKVAAGEDVSLGFYKDIE